jgi:hypothetical protein
MAGGWIACFVILALVHGGLTQDDLYMTWDAESELTPMYRAFYGM